MAKEKNDMNCMQISLFQEKNAVWINDIWDEKKKEKVFNSIIKYRKKCVKANSFVL